jgi:hypothetical protein
MLISELATPIDIMTGVYKHYKGGLYLVDGYSRNASDQNNLQISYVPLYVDLNNAGAVRTTRDWRQFFETVCIRHHGIPVGTEEHTDLRREDDMFDTCDQEKDWTDRFVYKGPVYLPAMSR